MKWTKTNNGNYINLELAYFIRIKQNTKGKEGSGEFYWDVIAFFPVTEGELNESSGGLESSSILLNSFDNKEKAQEYLDKLFSEK